MPAACQAMSSEAAEEASERVAIRQSMYMVGSMLDLERKRGPQPGEAEENDKHLSYIYRMLIREVNHNIDQSPMYK